MRSHIMLALLAGAGCGAAVSAELELPKVETPVAELPEAELPGAELLEFLGGWEGEDDEWQEFFDSLPVIHETTSPDDGSEDRDDRHEQTDQENER